jgi:hypothetical protein
MSAPLELDPPHHHPRHDRHQPNPETSMTNWIYPATNTLVVTKSLINFRREDDQAKFDQIIDLWRSADNSSDKPRELVRLFGEGLAQFLSLPSYIKDFETSPGKSAYGTWVRNALIEAMSIANSNKIRVTFDKDGPIFH